MKEIEMENFATAIPYLDSSIKLKPSVEALTLKGSCYYNLNRIDSAMSQYSLAFAIDSNYYKLREARGILYSSLNKETEAIKDFNASLASNPYVYETYVHMAISYEGLKNYKAGIEKLNKAIELNPEKSDAFFVKGSMLCADFGQCEEALSNINRAIEIDTLNGRYFYARALINLKSNNFDYVCDDYARAIKLKYPVESEDLKKRCTSLQ